MSAAEYVPETGGIAELRAAAQGCHGCELWEPATQTVFGAGSPDATILLVGEQPGDVEDQRGLPFVGPAGKVLQKALDEAGADRSTLYVTNAVKHFRFTWQRQAPHPPDPGRRQRRSPAARGSRPRSRRVDPQLVVVLGATAGKSLLGSGVPGDQGARRRLRAGDAGRHAALPRHDPPLGDPADGRRAARPGLRRLRRRPAHGGRRRHAAPRTGPGRQRRSGPSARTSCQSARVATRADGTRSSRR